MNNQATKNSQVAMTVLAALGAVALFGILEADFWSVKFAIGSVMASASFGIGRFIS